MAENKFLHNLEGGYCMRCQSSPCQRDYDDTSAGGYTGFNPTPLDMNLRDRSGPPSQVQMGPGYFQAGRSYWDNPGLHKATYGWCEECQTNPCRYYYPGAFDNGSSNVNLADLMRQWNEMNPPKLNTRIIEIRVPNYDEKTNYYVAGLAKCGVKVLEFKPLMMADEHQYLYPRVVDGKVVGASFYIEEPNA